MRLRGRSAETARLYECMFTQWTKHLGREPTLDDFDDLGVARYLEWRSANGKSPYTVEKERCQICSLWRFAADRNLVKSRPCVPPAPLPEKIPQAWTLAELNTLLSGCDGLPGRVCKIPAGQYFRALILVAWESGERIGALLSAKKSNLMPGVLLLLAEDRKGSKQPKMHQLSAETYAAAKAVADLSETDCVFPFEHSQAMLYDWLGKVKRRAGMPLVKRAAFHQVRRSAASHLASVGGDPVEFLGHSSPKLAKRYYLDPRICGSTQRPCDMLPSLAASMPQPESPSPASDHPAP